MPIVTENLIGERRTTWVLTQGINLSHVVTFHLNNMVLTAAGRPAAIKLEHTAFNTYPHPPLTHPTINN